MYWCAPPQVDFDTQSQYRWPFWKVDQDEDALFGSLHERFNTTSMFIQDADAFHRDVAEVARRATGKQGFLDQMQKRKDERMRELDDMLSRVGAFLVVGFHRPEDGRYMFPFARLSQNSSFDCLVGLCAAMIGPKANGREPSMDEFIWPEILEL